MQDASIASSCQQHFVESWHNILQLRYITANSKNVDFWQNTSSSGQEPTESRFWKSLTARLTCIHLSPAPTQAIPVRDEQSRNELDWKSQSWKGRRTAAVIIIITTVINQFYSKLKDMSWSWLGLGFTNWSTFLEIILKLPEVTKYPQKPRKALLKQPTRFARFNHVQI